MAKRLLDERYVRRANCKYDKAEADASIDCSSEGCSRKELYEVIQKVLSKQKGDK